MKKALSVLVTGVGGNIGQGIVKALRMTGRTVKVVGTDMEPLSVGLQRCDRGYVVAPAAKTEFIPQLTQIARKEKCDLIIPGSDTELPYLADGKLLLEENSQAVVLIAAAKHVHALHDKWLTYLLCKTAGVAHPETVLASNKKALARFLQKSGYPVLVKPRIGYGSRGVYVIHNRKEMDVFLSRVSNPVVQQSIGDADQEYTAACFVTPEHKKFGPIIFHRVISAGATYKAQVIRNPAMEKQILQIMDRLGVIGPCNIQYRLVRNKPVPFEFNLRYSGTTPMRAALGFNDVEMGIQSFLLGQTPRPPKIQKGVILRYWNEIVLTGSSFADIEAKGDGFIPKIPSQVVHHF